MTQCSHEPPNLYTPLPGCSPQLVGVDEDRACVTTTQAQCQPAPQLVCTQNPQPVSDPCLCMARLIAPGPFACKVDEEVEQWVALARCEVGQTVGRCECQAVIYCATHLMLCAETSAYDQHSIMTGATKGKINYLPEDHWNRTVWGQMFKTLARRSARPGISSGHEPWGDRW